MARSKSRADAVREAALRIASIEHIEKAEDGCSCPFKPCPYCALLAAVDRAVRDVHAAKMREWRTTRKSPPA